jgi:hypothetical protein
MVKNVLYYFFIVIICLTVVYEYESILVRCQSCNLGIKLIQSIDDNELALSTWINIHSMDLSSEQPSWSHNEASSSRQHKQPPLLQSQTDLAHQK